MLPTISKTLILGIIMCLVSLSHATSGSLDKDIYTVVEGDDAVITCTVINRNNEDIWWLIRYDTSPWYHPATTDDIPTDTPDFGESFAFYNVSTNVFVLQITNVSQTETLPTIHCGYATAVSVVLDSPIIPTNFTAFEHRSLQVWVQPICMYDVVSNNTQISLTCYIEGNNPSRGLRWYKNGDMPIEGPANDTLVTSIDIASFDYGNPYVCQADYPDDLRDNLNCEIIIPSPTILTTTEAMDEQITVTTETLFMTQTNELDPTETTNQTNSTFGFWTTMMIIVVAAPGGTIILILIIIIVVCLCSCMKQNKTDKTINNIEAASETNTKSDEKTNGANNHDTATTNGGMKMNEKNETKNGKTDMRKDDAIPVYDDVANEANADKTDGSNGEMINNGQDKETENTDENGELIPLYDNMREDKADAPDMSKANVEGLEYADIAIGSTMDGPPNNEDIIRKESATLYADLMV